MAKKTTVSKVLDLVKKFLEKHEGTWDHSAWESLVEELESIGLTANDEMRRNLGNILEACKYFHGQEPTKQVTKVKAKAKPKAKAAAKPRAKTKP